MRDLRVTRLTSVGWRSEHNSKRENTAIKVRERSSSSELRGRGVDTKAVTG